MGDLGVKVRGIAAMDSRINRSNLAAVGSDTTDSSYTRNTPRPGSAVSSDVLASSVPVVTAAQTNDLDFICALGGVPRIDGAALGYKLDTDANTEYRGYNELNLVTAPRGIQYSGTSAELWLNVDCVTIPGTQEIVVVGVDTGTGPVDNSSWTWDPATHTWGSRVTIETGSDSSVYSMIAATVIPGTSRVVVFMLDAAASPPASTAFYSDDSGATWNRYARDWAPAVNTTAYDRIVCEWDSAGNIIMLLEDTATGDFLHWTSDDGGQSFSAHDNGSALGTRLALSRYPDGRILLTYIEDTSLDAESLTFSDAFADITATPSTIRSTINVAWLVSWVDYDNVPYAAYIENSAGANPEYVLISRTVDDSENWLVMSDPVDGQVGTNRLELRCAAAACGTAALVYTGDAAMNASNKRSLYSLQCGGWSGLELKSDERTRARRQRPSFGQSAITGQPDGVFLNPTELVNQQGWTQVTSGTFTTSRSLNGHTLTGGAGQNYIHQTFAHQGKSVMYLLAAKVDSGGSLNSVSPGIKIRKADNPATFDYTVEIQWNTTGFRVWNTNAGGGAGASLGDVTVDNSEAIDIAISFTEPSKVVVWYKRISDDAWTLGKAGTLTDGGAGTADDLCVIGVGDLGTGSLTFAAAGWIPDVNVLHGIVDVADQYSRLEWGKPVNVYGYPLREEGDDDRRARVHWLGSPMRFAETWDVDAIAEYDVDRMLPSISPSPADPWRSTQTANDEVFVFDLHGDDEATEDSFPDGGHYIVVGLFNVNFRNAVIATRKASGAGGWTNVGTYDGAAGFASLNYRQDAVNYTVIIPDSVTTPTASAGRYLQAGEKVGGFAICDTTGTPEAIKIVSHTGGWWRDHSGADSSVAPYVRLASPPTNTTDDCHLVSPNGIIVIPVTSISAQFRWLRITITGGQTVPDSYYQIGSVFVGAMAAFGKQWSRGWSWRREPNIRVERDEYGTEYVTQLGPNIRELRVSWSEGVDSLHYRANEDVPTVGTASIPAVARDDVLHQLWGLQDLAAGGERPVVAVLDAPGTTTTLTDPTLFLYGSMRGRIQANHVTGDEGASELWRIEGLSVRELV